MTETNDIIDPGVGGGLPKTLPNATATLVLGICSIVGCFLYGIPGIACGIIAIVLHGKDKKIYQTDPEAYRKSYGNSKAGLITGIIGLSLSILWIIYLIAIFAFFGAALTAAMSEANAM